MIVKNVDTMRDMLLDFMGEIPSPVEKPLLQRTYTVKVVPLLAMCLALSVLTSFIMSLLLCH